MILFALLFALSAKANPMTFECSVEDVEFSGWLTFNSTLRGSLEKKGDRFVITSYDFFYEALDGDHAWSKADVKNATPVSNNPNYRPRVYKDHLQFDISKNVFGHVNLLLPHKALSSHGTFTAVLIMSWIDDHAGDTMFLDCTLDHE